MPVSTPENVLDLLDGTCLDSEAVVKYLHCKLVRDAVDIMNNDTLPRAVPLYHGDLLPTNERNLTDVRTRIGVLLEYEFARAVSESLPPTVREHGIELTYVVANQFPDLAFRTKDGRIGIRFEMKAIQTIAEEKSANFATLIKDIRKDTDFVVVLLWEWRDHESENKQYPHIDNFFVMDAYQLAQMRDCHWLNSPPSNLEEARQGFDLTFAVNARSDDSFNQEEGNLGKLMRIFDPDKTHWLPASVQQLTLDTYRDFAEEAVRLGLYHIGWKIAKAATDGTKISDCSIPDSTRICLLVEQNGSRLVILGDRLIPTKQQAIDAMAEHGADHALVMNKGFTWKVLDRTGGVVATGTKPAEASKWVAEKWGDLTANHLF